jgi:hypothetical protein
VSPAHGVEREVVGEIDAESTSERLGARAEVGVRQLHVGAARPDEFEHRARLQPLTHRRRVHPEQGTTAVAT